MVRNYLTEKRPELIGMPNHTWLPPDLLFQAAKLWKLLFSFSQLLVLIRRKRIVETCIALLEMVWGLEMWSPALVDLFDGCVIFQEGSFLLVNSSKLLSPECL